MLLGQLSLTAVAPDQRENFMERWLQRVRDDILKSFPGMGYVCGIHVPRAHAADRAKAVWSFELVIHRPYRRFVGQLSPEKPDLEHWRVDLVHPSAFSGSILTWSGAVGASIGYAVGRALRLLVCTLFGWSKTSDWEVTRLALLKAMTPVEVEAVLRQSGTVSAS